MLHVVTSAEMRAIDAATIEGIGLPGAVLMENAGRAVVAVVQEELARGGGAVAVVCGAGNNGGDGHVVARVLRQLGASVALYLAAPRSAVRGDALVHLAAYENTGGVVASIAEPGQLAEHRPAIEQAAVVVDALFGIGLARPIEGHLAAIIHCINRARGRIVAVDIPSGLSADSGEVLGAAVAAHRTVTMAFLKVGLAVAPGLARAGRVEVAEIGIPVELATAHGIHLARLEAADLVGTLPRAGLLDHKNRRGHALVVAGGPGKRGAARLTSMAALRAGAGLVTLAWEGREVPAPDPIMTAELDADAADAVERLVALAGGKRAIAIGPGMPTGEGGKALVRAALQRIEVPMVLDADALNHVAGELDRVAGSRAPVIMTPHPGEAARLLGVSTAVIERDRVGAVRELAERSRAVVVLKGAGTLVCDGEATDGFVTINPTGGPALATAGSGDVLTGVVAGLLAQGLTPADAARTGVFVHGLAGEACAERLGASGATASDVLDAVPRGFVRLRETR
ncbi:MAG TPA: NAD(P)H-hydrate dehydratase [Kofleriaceae bacterium]|nr:NAD(P)H-hydrate dehydratase [Kofleriaceae bacterium]